MLDNLVRLSGRLAKDPELKTTPDGKPVCAFTLAVKRYGRDEPDWIDAVAWEKTAEFITGYFEKGKLIAILGELRTRVWESKNGEKRKAVEVYVREAGFVSEKAPEPKTAPPPEAGQAEADDGEMPF